MNTVDDSLLTTIKSHLKAYPTQFRDLKSLPLATNDIPSSFPETFTGSESLQLLLRDISLVAET